VLSSVPVNSLRLEILASVSSENILALGCLIDDRMLWVLLRRLWPAWSNVLTILNQKPRLPGIGLAFGCSGAFDLNDLWRLIRRCLPSLSGHHADRIHDSREKDTLAMQPVSYKPDPRLWFPCSASGHASSI